MDTFTGLASLTLPLLTLCYFLMCLIWPFGPCRRCHGLGRFRGPMRGIRICRRCRGTGLRLRTGHRIWNHLRRLSRNAR